MPPNPKIHILGLGNLGRLFAHALATSPQAPPITLLFHRPSMLEDWGSANRRIEITTKDLSNTSTSSNYTIDVLDSTTTPQDPILNLIITTKTLHTIRALTPLLPRLNQNTTLLFAQNGMGTIEEVTSALFSNPDTRPKYLAAITSHGVYSTGPFRSVHAGLADVKVGSVVPLLSSTPTPDPTPDLKPTQDEGNDETSPLLAAIVSTPILNATSVPHPTLRNLQLEKLTINAILNPLTAILDIKNGEILNHDPVIKLTRLLVEECSRILLSLPELLSSSSTSKIDEGMTLEERFSPDRLEGLVKAVATKTAANTSSMLQDVQAGRETEIDYINGYFVRRGREVGVEVVLNERIAGMVREGVRVDVEGEELGKYFEGL